MEDYEMRPALDFQVSTTPIDGKGGLIVSVEGELDIATVGPLAESVGVAVADGRRLVLDLSECPFIDSTALAFVLRTHSALDADGKAMAVVAGRGEVRKLMYLTAIDRSVSVFARRGDAVALLGASAATGPDEQPWSEAAPIAGRPSE
jgi:anti-sigma B factor antagonist